MRKIGFITLLLLFSACKQNQEEKKIDIPWNTNKNESENTQENVKQDSSAIKKANWITYFETKRDHTLVEIKKIEQELVNEINEETKESLASLSKRQKGVNSRIEAFKKASKESLNKMRNELDSVFVDLDKFIKQVKSKIKK